MKLATLKDGSRDGQLAVVSRDLKQAHFATGIATRLQQVLDDWNFVSPQLEDLYTALNHGKARHAFAFDTRQCMAPLPRACHWVQVGAYPDAAERVLRSLGVEPPATLREAPPVLAAAGDGLLGAHDEVEFAAASTRRDFGPQLAVVTGDVTAGTPADRALDGVRLVLLANAWRGDDGDAAPPAAFAPVAVTPEELGEAWRGGKLALTVETRLDGRRFARLDAAAGMRWHFGRLIARVAATRGLGAGAIVGSGTIGAKDIADGAGCLAERRAAEAAAGTEPTTTWLATGSTLRVEAFAADGSSPFGAIEQRVSEIGE
ncbi:fumarylacetoacetate hydrolase family protein [Rubrivivax gelatinosus]|uniref:Fumarylacetoacetate (FAA) hydrolase n=1 Tax=Rubrivivax gelatinosus TaxID=28068 RepID=A0A4R2LYX0_RUBGE|nr:fumarylacetoacetate hydrolase family protein [Rubrivivax gelatinosus]MBK1690256.1 fumarylacetoacetate hydrolase [Rubrivivax gelatinosus]TCO98830.1 fumarylacetoacetate (FAA) hydrolase [Rubrivivax gelatinosus]